jgi:hypothetical protein
MATEANVFGRARHFFVARAENVDSDGFGAFDPVKLIAGHFAGPQRNRLPRA